MSIPRDYPYINSKDKKENHNPLLEYRDGHFIGKHPDNVNISEMNSAGHTNAPLAKIIRKNCLECCDFQPSEVGKCVATTCPLWPYRMGKNPFQAAKCKNKPSNLNKSES